MPNTGAALAVKRETGEIPVRSRHCKRGAGAKATVSWARLAGKGDGKELSYALIREPGDLPVPVRVSMHYIEKNGDDGKVSGVSAGGFIFYR